MKNNLLKLSNVILATSLSIAATNLTAYGLKVEEVSNPRKLNYGWVSDEANILNKKTENQLNQMISNLEAKNGTEIAVVTVPKTAPAASPKQFTTKLFNHWGIGKKGKNNGVLFLVSLQDRRIEIETGYGLQKVLPKTKIVNIIDTKIKPSFKQENFDAGTLAGTEALIVALQPSTNNQSINSVSEIKEVPSTQENNLLPWIIFAGGTGIFIWILTVAARTGSKNQSSYVRRSSSSGSYGSGYSGGASIGGGCSGGGSSGGGCSGGSFGGGCSGGGGGGGGF